MNRSHQSGIHLAFNLIHIRIYYYIPSCVLCRCHPLLLQSWYAAIFTRGNSHALVPHPSRPAEHLLHRGLILQLTPRLYSLQPHQMVQHMYQLQVRGCLPTLAQLYRDYLEGFLLLTGRPVILCTVHPMLLSLLLLQHRLTDHWLQTPLLYIQDL